MKVFTPKNGVVMVLRDENAGDTLSEGGLVIPNRAVELANEGEVRASCEFSEYEVGTRVVFTKYAGSEFALNGVTYILLPEKDIQGHIRDVASATDAVRTSSEDLAAVTQAALAALAKSGIDTTAQSGTDVPINTLEV